LRADRLPGSVEDTLALWRTTEVLAMPGAQPEDEVLGTAVDVRREKEVRRRARATAAATS
jgi:hypothetical protein